LSGAYIGPIGQLVEIAHYKGSVSVQQDRDVSFKTTLGGGRRAFAAPNLGLRSWDVSAPMLTPTQAGQFEGMVATSNGPFWWVEPLAQHSNVVTHRGSLFQAGVTGGGTVTGAFTGADGVRLPASLAALSGTVYFASGTPVIPGKKVTGSAYATNGARVHLHLLDAGGATITNISATATTEGQRLTISTTVPAGAVTARLAVAASTNPGTVAGPAITWTSGATPWGMGMGAAQTVVSGVSSDVVLASEAQQFKNLGFTVTEVGAGA